MSDHYEMSHWSDTHNACDYTDEETGERKGCGSLINSTVIDQCEACRHDDYVASIGLDEYNRRCTKEREVREAEFQASLAWNRLTGSAQKPPAAWREIVASAQSDARDQPVKITYLNIERAA